MNGSTPENQNTAETGAAALSPSAAPIPATRARRDISRLGIVLAAYALITEAIALLIYAGRRYNTPK